jgi:carbamoyl-phosphate synthase small subunit
MSLNGLLKFKNYLFKGILYGKNVNVSGELVFTTSLVGYNESITDPSYKNQILVFTNPLIGNYGVPPKTLENNLLKYFESDKIHVSGIIVGNYSTKYSHHNAIESLDSFCKKNNVPLLSNIDTRMLTTYLRDHGTINGEIYNQTEINNISNKSLIHESKIHESLIHPIIQVSTKKVITYNSTGKIKICLIDCGTKNNIIRSLINRDCQVDLVPYNTDISNSINYYHGIVIGNGPGDTSNNQVSVIIKNIRKIINSYEIPIFGICAGHQLLGLSAGFDVYKMKFGHRSHNAPVLDTFTNRCYITSQNHGYCIKNTYLPKDWNISFINLNDNTIEGIEHKFKPYFSVQFHPEGNSGSKDTEFLFDKFINKCLLYKK